MTLNLLPPPTTVWGPHGWRFLHYVSLGYPNDPTEQDKEHYRMFYAMIGNILPCSLCSTHYKENYKKIPLTDEILSSKEKLVEWVITVHNVVNEMTGKRIIPMAEAKELINTNVECKPTHKKQHKHSNMNSIYDVLPLLAILGILITIALAYKKK